MQDVLGAVRSHARRQDREGNEGRSGLGGPPRATPTLEKGFSSMANLAEAEGAGVDSADDPSASSVRDTLSESFGGSAGINGCGGVVTPVDVPAGGALSSDEADRLLGEGGQPSLREGGGAVPSGCPSSVERDKNLDLTAVRAVGTKKHEARREQSVSASEPPSEPVASETERVRTPSKCSAGYSVVDMEGIAATQIQATCRRRAAQDVVRSKRNRCRLAGERKARPPVRGGGRAATTQQQQQQQQGNLEELREGSEEERAASLIQKTHHQAMEIRRARTEREQCLRNQQFLFGPGFQQPTSLNKRDSGPKSSSGSEGQSSRCRDAASLTLSEEDRRQGSKSRAAAIKIQSQVRRTAASRWVAAARQRRVVTPKITEEAAVEAAVAAAASMPKLPIASLVLPQASAARRAAPKVQREPLAILRQLRRDDSKAPLKPRTDQFRLRVTIKSAIEAHIKKTGAARRKPRPLPTPPSWRQQHSMASSKAKMLQQNAAATRVPLAKPRVVSPLHRTVRKVNMFITADKPHGQAAGGPGRRARSAPSRATDRLRCAIFAAETMVEREYARQAEGRQSFAGGKTPVDELSRDLLASPLLVPCQPMA